jgi:histidinol-phosphatase (PHP family)
VVSQPAWSAGALGNYHTHSKYDDGHGELEEYAVAAISKGFSVLGFSGHAPMPVVSDWLMKPEGLVAYLADFRRIAPRYADRLTMLLGLEVDYLPGFSEPRSEAIRALGLDYVLGSVHFVHEPARGGAGWTVDGDAEELDRGLVADFGGDMQAVVVEYYRRLAEMVTVSPPDIVGHFDLVKKNNRGEHRFSESAPWYREAVFRALEAIAASPCVLEINTGGLVRGTTDTIYPSPWILDECRERRIRIVVNADAHRPANLDGHFAEAFALLRASGYRTRALLTHAGWQDVEL